MEKMHSQDSLLSLPLITQETASVTPIEFEKDKKINVAFLVFNQVEALDLNGPIDIFAKANVIDNRYNLYTVSQTKDAVDSEGSVMKITAKYTFKNAPAADILIIPGAHPDIVAKLCKENAELINWINLQNKTTKITMSICTGGLILSKTGILDGKKAITHFMSTETLRANTKINVVENVRYVQDGKIITTAGITSGIDGTLHVIDLINGKEVTDMIAKIMYYNRNGDLSFMKE
jgi:transcriptional regulator GlxA family with amidase domain